ncbi:MAG: ATP-dependent DNA helicase RecG [Firmicutes bacterium]|nr:ATP-dependent DNA helicase RecG [Bacillota bacterium]
MDHTKKSKESFEEIVVKILLPFREELKRGCKNDAVIGGFDTYVKNWLDLSIVKAPPKNRLNSVLLLIKQKFYQYSGSLPSKRAEILKITYPVLNHIRENPANPDIEKMLSGLTGKSAESPSALTEIKPDYQNQTDIKKRTANKLSAKTNRIALTDSVKVLTGIGVQTASALEKLDIKTLEDLIFNIPREYQDRNAISGLDKIEPDKFQAITGTLGTVMRKNIRHGLNLVKTALYDENGSISLIWFNQPYIFNQLKKGKKYLVMGKVEQKYGEVQISNPEMEELGSEPPAPRDGMLSPVYRLTEGIGQKLMGKMTDSCLNKYLDLVEEIFPDDFRKKLNLMHIRDALKAIHHPKDQQEVEQARLRLVFEEAFLMQLSLAIQRRKRRTGAKKIKYNHSPAFMRDFEQSISFSLTDAQRRVIEEILGDMHSPEPMNRLLQGDVGSGKTIVCVYFSLLAAKSGYQSVIMAPTEILAEQHYYRFREILDKFGVSVALITGSTPAAEKEVIKQNLRTGTIDVAIGTHALIQEDVGFANPAFAVIDEQHRFGVMQRTILKEKGMGADFLFTTATPIPRSLCLTIYGELDVSLLDEIPPGRQKIKTLYVTGNEKKQVYSFIKKELEKDGQAYVICPVIEESEKLELTPLTQEFELIRKEFDGIPVAMLHGKMRGDEKEKIMKDFSAGKYKILVSTTVVEVGVDVPNATVMAVLDAQRFGLGQLHQLRGRIGRGVKPSICILVSGEESSPESSERLTIMTKMDSGFDIAEADLKIRGPGDISGFKQSGMPDFRFIDLVKDYRIIQKAREEAFYTEKQDPDLGNKEYIRIKEKIRSKYRSIWDIIH